MKAMASEKTSYARSVRYQQTSRISKHKKDLENEEIQAYLSKLKELVPFMPKDRRLSKLDIIHRVINYIAELQRALETHPTIDSAAVQTAAATMLHNSVQEDTNSNLPIATPQHRQPLGVLPPNANFVVNTTSSLESSPVSSSRQGEKVSSSTDGKALSC